MSFCMAVFMMIITISLSEIVTLQVRIPKKHVIYYFSDCYRRKTFLSVSGNPADGNTGIGEKIRKGNRMRRQSGAVSASLTLEAAFVLSLLIFASVSLILPMKILNTERKVQAALEAVGEDFSQYAYLQDVLQKGEAFHVKGADGFSKTFCQYLVKGAAEVYAQAQVMKHVDTKALRHATMIRSEILEDGEHFNLVLDYDIQMPFPVLGIGTIRRTAKCRRRAWIGKEGKDAYGNGTGSNPDDEIVYVGKGSTRYHRNRDCHYLANHLISVPFEQVADRRNESGGKYHACAVCGKQAAAGSTVYISPEGSSYHTTKICTSIVAYVRAVKLSEVKHLGACSYCSQ